MRLKKRTGKTKVRSLSRAESRRHRIFVASLPCARCGIETYSQCAHIKDRTGTAGAEDYHTLPLCCERLGVEGCHKEQHRVSEPVFYEPFGGIPRAKYFGECLFKCTGDETEGRYLMEKFRAN